MEQPYDFVTQGSLDKFIISESF